MSSTFRRRPRPDASSDSSSKSHNNNNPASLLLKGTTPWTGGRTLTSTGWRDLDGLLQAVSVSSSSTSAGGGQATGTCVSVVSNRWSSSLAEIVVQYWCAEAISQEHHLLIPSVQAEQDAASLQGPSGWEDENETFPNQTAADKVQNLLHSLPRNLHKDKEARGSQGATPTLPSSLGTLMEGDDDDEDAKKAEADLTIAWQYSEAVQQERSGKTELTNRKPLNDSVYCHSYDLQGHLSDQVDVEQATTVLPVSCGCNSGRRCRHDRTCAFAWFRQVHRKIESLLKEERKLVRVLLYHVDARLLRVGLPLLMAQIRSQELPAVVLILSQTQQASHEDAALDVMQRSCDVVLEAESFSSRHVYPPPPEFAHLHGLLHVHRLNVTGSCANGVSSGHFGDWTVSKRPSALTYGLKRDRRKLHLQLLHIPPEDYAQGGGSVGGGGVRSGAGRKDKKKTTTTTSSKASSGCASGGGDSLLDF